MKLGRERLHLDEGKSNDEIDFYELFRAVRENILVILVITFVSSFTSIVIALSKPNIYRSDVLLAPASSSSVGMSGAIQKYAGLASLAGVSLPAGESSKAALAIEVLKSRKFIIDFISRRDIWVPLLATKSWDKSTGNLLIDEEIYDPKTKFWRQKSETDRPSALEAYSVFSTLLKISTDKESGLVNVAVTHQSPILAQRWVSWLVEDLNNYLRDQDVEEATKSIEYLKNKINSTSLTELKAKFFELIQEQTQTIMLAQVRPEYVFKTIDPSVVPEKKDGPSRVFMLLIGTIIGLTAGFFWVFVFNYLGIRQMPENL